MPEKYIEKNIHPLVSIFCTVKNAEITVRRHIQAILAAMQLYDNIEYVVHDGLSTDGTLNVFEEYRKEFGDKLKIVSMSDSCSEEGFWLALSRCKGEIICASLADEEILPDAIPFIIKKFQDNPWLDIIHGDIYNTDINGNIQCRNPSADFDLIDFLSHKLPLHFASSFFRRSAFINANLLPYPSKYGLLKDDFFTWAYLGLQCHIEYSPKVFAKYAIHDSALSVDPKRIPATMSGRSDFFDFYFESDQVPKKIKSNKKYILFNFYSFAADLLKRNNFNVEAQIYIKKRDALVSLFKVKCFLLISAFRRCRRMLKRFITI